LIFKNEKKENAPQANGNQLTLLPNNGTFKSAVIHLHLVEKKLIMFYLTFSFKFINLKK